MWILPFEQRSLHWNAGLGNDIADLENQCRLRSPALKQKPGHQEQVFSFQ